LSRLRPHIPGLIYTGLLLLIGLAAVNNQNNLLFWVFGVMVSALLISAGLTFIIMRSVRIRRLDIQHGSVGEPMLVRYAVSNRSRLLSVFNLYIEERSSSGAATWRKLMKPATAWVMHVGPRESVHGETIFWPTVRGEARFHSIRISTTFPFGIIRKSRVIHQPQHTLVFPMLYELKRGVLSALIPTGLIGTRVSHHPGAGDDYFGMREFKPGDSLRHIAWKRTAQFDELVSIDRTSPSPARVRVILDLSTPTAQLKVNPTEKLTARELEERAISLAASVIHAAEIEGFEIGLTVRGTNLAPIAVRRNRWHASKMMAALAAIDLDSPRTSAQSETIREAERAALVVIAPDRSSPLASRPDAWFLTARQLDSLAVKAIGWDPQAGQVKPSVESVPMVVRSIPKGAAA
jgi:uncharacterized protein (DUF58 family)